MAGCFRLDRTFIILPESRICGGAKTHTYQADYEVLYRRTGMIFPRYVSTIERIDITFRTAMTDLRKEKPVNYLVEHDKPGRRIETFRDCHWGELILPAAGENPEKTAEGMRIALFCSWEFGYLVLQTLKEFEHRFPSRLNLVGLVTDNPVNHDARISMKKRIWRFFNRPKQVAMETHIIEQGLSHGLPLFPGEVKTESFHATLAGWRPDVILMCVFGQLVDADILSMPPYGMYNFHPSDLTLHMGAGPSPYDDLVNHDAATTV